MSRLPRLTADKFIRILERLGFNEIRQEGGHKIFKNIRGIRATVPYHRRKILHPKIIKTFLNDSGLSPKDLEG